MWAKRGERGCGRKRQWKTVEVLTCELYHYVASTSVKSPPKQLDSSILTVLIDGSNFLFLEFHA